MNKLEKLATLRRSLTPTGRPADRPVLPLGVAAADAALGGGLLVGALHEVFVRGWSAAGFAAALALLAARDGLGGSKKPLFWVRPDYEALEYGGLHAAGFGELGGCPDGLFLVRAPNAAEALAAGNDILACPHVGALLLEISGRPRALDLVASRRLGFLAAQTGVTVIVLREGAEPAPSAAQTRWQAVSAPSDETDWGQPTFRADLIRNRAGPTGRWTLQWNPENGLFREPPRKYTAPSAGLVAAAPLDRPVAAERHVAFREAASRHRRTQR